MPRRSNVCESLDVETHGDRRRDRVVAPVTGRGVARAWRHRLIPRRPDVADLGGLLTPCLGCVRPHGNPPYDAVVTIRFANCARALSTHLTSPFRGASITQTSNSGRRSPAAAHFANAVSPPAARSRTGRLLTGDGAQTSASSLEFENTAVRHVARSQHSPRAAVSPARDGIGSVATAAGGGPTWEGLQ